MAKTLSYNKIWLFSVDEGKSAASFGLQVEVWVSDVFCNFYLLKNHKIADK
jgi:hypothetical protein